VWWLCSYANNVVAQKSGRAVPGIDVVSAVMDYYMEQSRAITAQLDGLKARKDALSSEQSTLSAKLHATGRAAAPSVSGSHDCTVVLHCDEPCDVQLFVTYLVTNASWKPSYGEPEDASLSAHTLVCIERCPVLVVQTCG
jgi:hypothetical protein